jgi:hypothetical protein
MLQYLVKVDGILHEVQDEQGWPKILPYWCILADCGDLSKEDSVLCLETRK